MPTYRFTQNYASDRGAWRAGDEADFDAATASWINRDVPGALEGVGDDAPLDVVAGPSTQVTPDYDRILDRPLIVDPASLKEQEAARRQAVAIAPSDADVDLDVVANDGTHPAQQDAAPVVEAVIEEAEAEEEKLEDAAETDGERQKTASKNRQATSGKNRSA
jgi:hypothetical protein